MLKEFSVKPKPVLNQRQYVPSKGGTAKTVKEKWSWNFIEHLRVRITFREGCNSVTGGSILRYLKVSKADVMQVRITWKTDIVTLSGP